MYLVWHSWVVKVVDLFSSYRAMREYYLYVSDYTLCAIDLPFEDVIMHILYMQSSIHAASCRPVLPGFRRDNNHRHLSSIDTSSACVCMPLTPSTFTPPAHSEIPKVIRHATRVSSHKVSIYIYIRAMVVEIIVVAQAAFDQAFSDAVTSPLHSSRAVLSPSKWISATSSESSELGAPVGTVKTSSWAPAGDGASPATSPLIELADVM